MKSILAQFEYTNIVKQYDKQGVPLIRGVQETPFISQYTTQSCTGDITNDINIDPL